MRIALYHTKGMAAAETKAAFDQARAMIERAEALGEHVEDPLLLYSVLYGFFMAKFITFDGDAACALATPIPYTRRAAKGDGPYHDRASSAGHYLAVYGRRSPKG